MRFRPLSLAVSIVTISAGLLTAGPSHALTFDFSFSNDTSVGNVAGTVTGEIDGLVDNSSGESATAIYIDSYPSGLSGIPASNVNLLSAWSVSDNVFTVSAGKITSDNVFLLGPSNLEFFALGNVQSVLEDVNGNATGSPASGVVYTPVGGTAPIPEPVGISVLAMGLIGLATVRFRVNPSPARQVNVELL